MSQYTNKNICWYYNPYFQNGCQKGAKCEFTHLEQSRYEEFVESKRQNKAKSVMFHEFKLAVKKFHRKQYHLASEMLKDLLYRNPHIPRFNLWCGRTMEKLGSFKTAAQYYGRAISTQPQNATYHGRYATLLHMKLNNLESAKVHYEIALKLRNDINAVHCHYGKLLCDLGGSKNYDRAEYHFKTCLEYFEKDEECHFYYGQLLYKLGDMRAAETHVKRALYLQNKTYIWHYYYYALICIELQRFDDAKQYLQICLDLQYSGKAMVWAGLYFEYGLLLIFKFNSFELGAKYLYGACQTYSKKTQSEYHKIYEIIRKNKENLSNLKYSKFRQINKDKVFINENENKLKKDNAESKNESDSDSTFSGKSNWCFYLNNTLSSPTEDSNNSNTNTLKLKEIDSIHKESMDLKPEKNKKCSVENEFYLFLHNLGMADKYLSKFQNSSVNDIRIIEHIDDKFLSKTIGMSNCEINRWRDEIRELKLKRSDFLNKWKRIDRFSYTLFYDIFAQNGVMTAKSFFYYFEKPNDILYLVNDNSDYAKLLCTLFETNCSL